METKDIKKIINNYDNMISHSKGVIRELDKLEENFLSMDKSFGKYLSLLNESVKGRKVNMILNESYEVKNKCISESLSTLSKSRETVKKELDGYIKNKDRLEKEYKKKVEDNKK